VSVSECVRVRECACVRACVCVCVLALSVNGTASSSMIRLML